MGKVLLLSLFYKDESWGLEKLNNLHRVTKSGFRGTSVTHETHSQACSYSLYNVQDIVIEQGDERSLSLSSHHKFFIISYLIEGEHTTGQNHSRCIEFFPRLSHFSTSFIPKPGVWTLGEGKHTGIQPPCLQIRPRWKIKFTWDHDYNFTYLETMRF